MDYFFMYAITLVTFPISIIIIFLIHKRVKGSRLNRRPPPGSSGLPLIGETISLALSGPQKFVSDRMKKYSADVFLTSLLGEKIALFCGPQGNKFIFSSSNDAKLLPWLPKSFRKITLFPEFMDYSIKDVTALMITLSHDILKPESLKQYIPIMDMVAREHVEKEWAPNQQVKVYPLTKKYTLDLAFRLMLSTEDAAEMEKLADPFRQVIRGLLSLPINLPGTTYNRAIKAGKTVRQELLKMVRARRKEQIMENNNQKTDSSSTDILSRLLRMTNEKGENLSEKEISTTLLGLLVANYEATSTTITFVLKQLAELPHIYNQVLKEHMEIAKNKRPEDLLTWADIQKMKYSWNVIRETLRVTPTTQGMFRESFSDFSYAGFTIPKGWKGYWNVYTTHKNPKYFPDPEKFDPTRFEGSGPMPYTYVPFGGGSHICPGKDYAKVAILVYMHNIVRRYKLEKVYPNEKILFHALPVLEKGLHVNLHLN